MDITSWSPRSKRWGMRNLRLEGSPTAMARFPKEVNNLIVTAAVKAYAAAAGIASVIKKADGIELKYSETSKRRCKKTVKNGERTRKMMLY